MTAKPLSVSHMFCVAAAFGLLSACSGGQRASMSTPSVALDQTPLDYHKIGVQASTEVLEIAMDPGSSSLSAVNTDAIERFVAAYRDRGHGQLVIAMPENGANDQLSSVALNKARTIAWTKGVAYERIDDKAYDAKGANAPLLLAFDVYEAVAPDCLSLAAYDMSDISSNNEPAYFGCAVRSNIAAMLSDPGDLLGEREIEARDNRRVSIVMQAYMTGG